VPTIEVDDSDVIFVVKGRGEAPGGYHELGPRDLIVMMQMVPEEDARDSIQVMPYTRIFVGGTPVGGIERFRFETDSYSVFPTIEVMFPEPWVGHYRDELLSRLEPFVTVRYTVGVTPEKPQATEPDLPVERVSRYSREPVI
jgi:hypothetical protein